MKPLLSFTPTKSTPYTFIRDFVWVDTKLITPYGLSQPWEGFSEGWLTSDINIWTDIDVYHLPFGRHLGLVITRTDEDWFTLAGDLFAHIFVLPAAKQLEWSMELHILMSPYESLEEQYEVFRRLTPESSISLTIDAINSVSEVL